MSPAISDLPKALRERAEHSIAQLRAALEEYKNVCYANGLGSESVVLTDLIWGAVAEIDMFSIDGGRLYPETHDLIERLGRGVAHFKAPAAVSPASVSPRSQRSRCSAPSAVSPVAA